MNKILLIKIFFVVSVSFAQEIFINIVGVDKAVLFEFEGEQTHKIDSVFSQIGSFQFSLDENHSGGYRLQFDNRHFLDFINYWKDVEINTDHNNISDSLRVINTADSLNLT